MLFELCERKHSFIILQTRLIFRVAHSSSAPLLSSVRRLGASGSRVCCRQWTCQENPRPGSWYLMARAAASPAWPFLSRRILAAVGKAFRGSECLLSARIRPYYLSYKHLLWSVTNREQPTRRLLSWVESRVNGV